MTLLKDGVKFKEVIADSKGQFSFAETSLPEAVYSFGFLAEDTDKRLSRTFNTTFAIKQAVKTTLTSVITTPTIEADKKTISVAENLVLRGQSAPLAMIELVLEPNRVGVLEKDRLRQTVAVGADGKWQITFDTKKAVQGSYIIKARTNISLLGYSDFSNYIAIGIGQTAIDNGSCSGPDLNRDGKVNLIDFSILLYNWGTNKNPCADFNKNGKVDLPDFSIMLYSWTG